MATPADIVQQPGAPLCHDETRVQLNNATRSLRLLTAKLDADSGVSGTDYASTITEATNAPALVVLKSDAADVVADPPPAASSWSLDWNFVRDRMTPQTMVGVSQDGPVDRGTQATYPLTDTSWAVSPGYTALGPWYGYNITEATEAAIIAGGGEYYTTGGAEDSQTWSHFNYGGSINRQVSTNEWNSLLNGGHTYPKSGRVFCRMRAYDLATVGAVFRYRLRTGQYAVDSGSPETGTIVGTDVTLTADWQNVELPFAFADVPDPTNLFVSIGFPLGVGYSYTIEVAKPTLLVAGAAAPYASDRDIRSLVHTPLGLWVGNMTANLAYPSDDFSHARYTLTGVTQTPVTTHARDYAYTGATLTRLAFTSGGTIAQTVDLLDLDNVAYTPDYVWLHLYVEQDGVNPLPGAGDLLADVVGSAGTYTANFAARDRFGFMRARVPLHVGVPGETATSITAKIRAKTGTTWSVLACRFAIEAEEFESARRCLGNYDLVIPPRTETGRHLQLSTETAIMRAADVMDRNQGTWIGRYNLPYNPALQVETGLQTASNQPDHRLLYAGPPASARAFADFKISSIGQTAGHCQVSMSFGDDQGGGNAGDFDAIEFICDASYFPANTDFTVACVWGRSVARRPDALWINGVKVAGIITHNPPSGAGTSTYQLSGALYMGVDCDKVNAISGFLHDCLISTTALTDAEVEAKIAAVAAA